MSEFDPASIRALVFDVFGTVVDWRGSIIREGEALSAAKGLSVDWRGVADAWRQGYQPAMARAARGEIAWANIDTLHRGILDEIRPRFGLGGLDEREVGHLNRVWHRLVPWPDALDGLQRLKTRFTISTLSNGNVSLLVDMAKNAGLPWDCVLSAELFGKYKPDPAVYQGAAQLLGVERDALLMVAAHPSDLVAAQRAGLRAAYVSRPLEWGLGGYREPLGDARFDVIASDFVELAAKLGA
ncbi:MAG TPA: haloacid dehalogenase type II [Burkholderiaceae bacterium]|nr:haloacid dehalogenase type II [Burkholderiaceae bacterium]